MRELLALGQDDAMILLLDEWDANLDSANQVQLDAWLDELAKHKLTIEVRHGHDDGYCDDLSIASTLS